MDRQFHRFPDLSKEEHSKADRIEEELTALGLEPQRIYGTGVVAVVSNDELQGVVHASSHYRASASPDPV